jgi:hypothetical protein
MGHRLLDDRRYPQDVESHRHAGADARGIVVGKEQITIGKEFSIPAWVLVVVGMYMLLSLVLMGLAAGFAISASDTADDIKSECLT